MTKKLTAILFLLISTAVLLEACAPGTIEPACESEYEADGFGVEVELISADSSYSTYHLTICENSGDLRAISFNMYGGDNDLELNNIYPNVPIFVRKAMATSPSPYNDSDAGERYEIELPSDNTVFSIYEAELDSNGKYILGAENEILRGSLID